MINENYIYTLYAQGAGAVCRYISQLDSRIEDAEARVAHSQQARVAQLSKELARSHATLRRKSQQLIHARQLNHQLQRRIRELEHELERDGGAPVERDSHNSSLPPSLDLPWRKVKRTRSLRQQSGMHVGGQPGHKGSTLKQVAQPDEIIIHRSEACTQCGAQLHHGEFRKIIRRQVFDIVDGRLQVTEHQAEARRCWACGLTTTAKFPASVRAPVQYGTGVLSRSVYLHLYQLIPVARTAEAMRDLFACAISPATIGRAARIASGKMVNTEQRIKAAIRDSPVIGADETGLRVGGASGYVHVARTPGLTHYAYDMRRGRAAMDEVGILPQFRGTLVRDGYLSYSRFERCRHSLCNAHLLRELLFVAEVSPEQQEWATPLAKLLLKMKEEVAAAKTEAEVGLSEPMKAELLQRYDKLVKKAERLNPPLPKSKVAGDAPKTKPPLKPTPHSLIKRLHTRRDEVLRFMTDITVPFDNNGSERDLRMVKLQQKISGRFRTSDGARNFCRVRSYLSTARKQGHSLLYSLERVLAGKPLLFRSQNLPLLPE
ncbi:MAG TPA: IS66 family transposase [Pyrinomonadaceae bacterium]|nr:IS66 family transposase [Pyrinomonadaceae bacterium]